VALQTAASLITLLAGFLVLGRLRRNSRRNELVLVTALAAIAASNVLFVMLPMLMGPATANTAVWAAMIGRLVGSLLFAAAAFVPRAGLLHPRRAERLSAAGVLGVLALAIAIPQTFGAGLPQVISMSAGAHSDRGLHLNAALVVVQIAAAVLCVTAAAGYLRRSELDLASGVGLAPAQADALVQIACEALTNVARHSGSRQAHLVLRRDGGRVHLLVRDPGRGFDTAASRPGFGLRSMQARARAVGGELRVTSAPGTGSLVEATL
jgi:hypothetical protein